MLREIIGFTAERLMEREVATLTGAARDEKSPKRLVRHNGYRERHRDARVRTVELSFAKLRTGCYFPGLLEAQRMIEKSLTALARLHV